MNWIREIHGACGTGVYRNGCYGRSVSIITIGGKGTRPKNVALLYCMKK